MNRHLLAHTQIVLVAGQLMSHLLNRESAPQEGTRLTVLREDEIVGSECCSCADSGSLLTALRHVEGDSSLALGCVEDIISLVHRDHFVVHLEDQFITDLGVVAWSNHVSFFVEHAEAFDFVKRALEVHFARERVLKQALVDLIHSAETTCGHSHERSAGLSALCSKGLSTEGKHL